ncbi:MAG: hypothetical protein R2911_43075 [Caldilineaceae bacterium]
MPSSRRQLTKLPLAELTGERYRKQRCALINPQRIATEVSFGEPPDA